ncbi:SGNH/GDSL hydrolase family protein [Flaviramulus sp. BrNp1-15]|uniref:SGNH/GDSL hydrolase family protein n=1 Tax=Flaviramulus sp. BrNp1-15 TaxID=2916754 RepID=UPI001EE897AD|nr:SGNH/GDSL hydrolase family protein [Flaviramulus sp. BrNp1-15]ULC60078.1 SGNH/GDSL hydrolase family protein [Flaviramulus sp. BrNp1-15]
MKKITYLILCCGILYLNCNSETSILEEQEEILEEAEPETTDESETSEEENDDDDNDNSESQNTYKILSLGDSYTIGQSVCANCRFPEQLKDSLVSNFDSENQFELKIVATTGWTTTNLIDAIDREDLKDEYDLVTLLIGVNNQYQNKPFSIYESEFPQLVNTAISKAKGDKNNVIVVSIPDYAFTPFGNGNTAISTEIDNYNNFAENYCSTNEITYVYITDITRMGLDNTNLVAADGLHPSKLAYSMFVERILPLAIEKIKD